MNIHNTAIANFARNNKAFFITALLAGVIGSACTIFISLSVGSFYQLVFHSSGNKSRLLHLFGFHTATSVHHFFIFYFSLLLLKVIADWLFNYCSKVSANKLSGYIRDHLFEYQLNTRYSQFSEKSPARYLLRYSGDLQAIQHFYVKGILTFTRDMVLLFTGFYFLFRINFYLSFVLLAAVPLQFLLNFLLNIPLRKLLKEKRDRASDLLTFVSHCFHAILSVKAFRKEKIEGDRFRKKSAKLSRSSINYYFYYAFVQSVAPVLLYSVLGVVMLLVAEKQVPISYGDLMAFILLGILQFSALRRIAKIETVWRSGNISLKKINALLGKTTEGDNPGPNSIIFHSLKFNNLQLDERDSTNSRLSAHLLPGSIHYISCSNPEQFIRILLGVAESKSGEILLNNQSLDKFKTTELRKLFSFSSDYLPLYGKDLYEMAARSKKHGRNEKVEKVLKRIGFNLGGNQLNIQACLEKNNTLLSIHDRKLISLARALLQNNPILILDRPFEGVNEEIALLCDSYLKTLVPGKTIIIIKNLSDIYIGKAVISADHLYNLS